MVLVDVAKRCLLLGACCCCRCWFLQLSLLGGVNVGVAWYRRVFECMCLLLLSVLMLLLVDVVVRW